MPMGGVLPASQKVQISATPQDPPSFCGFPMDFETLVISFSYLIPASGPGKIEARAQQKSV